MQVAGLQELREFVRFAVLLIPADMELSSRYKCAISLASPAHESFVDRKRYRIDYDQTVGWLERGFTGRSLVWSHNPSGDKIFMRSRPLVSSP